ncbi:hypothetical protein Nepgr_015825 [Nepenthes gracilis]|uniref:Uncharacterized protein n=1 Tax=Nepenthes gracilis TaxID=150966 RepID=A0AAD3SNH0_NEPGR|nr:hypothetical protein Nepgr_015825 [Nepenthes gracilis]
MSLDLLPFESGVAYVPTRCGCVEVLEVGEMQMPLLPDGGILGVPLETRTLTVQEHVAVHRLVGFTKDCIQIQLQHWTSSFSRISKTSPEAAKKLPSDSLFYNQREERVHWHKNAKDMLHLNITQAATKGHYRTLNAAATPSTAHALGAQSISSKKDQQDSAALNPITAVV